MHKTNILLSHAKSVLSLFMAFSISVCLICSAGASGESIKYLVPDLRSAKMVAISERPAGGFDVVELQGTRSDDDLKEEVSLEGINRLVCKVLGKLGADIPGYALRRILLEEDERYTQQLSNPATASGGINFILDQIYEEDGTYCLPCNMPGEKFKDKIVFLRYYRPDHKKASQWQKYSRKAGKGDLRVVFQVKDKEKRIIVNRDTIRLSTVNMLKKRGMGLE